MNRYFMGIWKKFLEAWDGYLENRAKKKYLKFGLIIGDSESYGYLGEPGNYWSDWHKWHRWENRIIDFGYQPHSLQSLIECGGYGRLLPELRKLEPGEEPIRYSLIRKAQKLAGSDKHLRVSNETPDGAFIGQYELPGTETAGGTPDDETGYSIED